MKKPALNLHEVLYGRQSAEQQWKRCVSQLKNLFGIAITAMTARREIEQSQHDIHQIIDAVKQQVLKTVLEIPIDLSMKESLVEKLSSIDIFVGFSKELLKNEPLERFYEDLVIDENEFFKTAINLEIFSMKSYGRKLLKPIKETNWESFTGSSFQKSFYSAIKRTIFIHPNDLKSPIYNAALPNYINFARLGWQVANLFAIVVSSYQVTFLPSSC